MTACSPTPAPELPPITLYIIREELRSLHLRIYPTVAAAYGWSDLDLGHGFHATKQGERYSISESTRRTILDRLVQLNHERYAEEGKAGLHDKGAKQGKAKKSSATTAASPQSNLFI